MLYMVGSFDFNSEHFTLDEAERHYRDYHVPLARQLPGLRRYVIGRLVQTRTVPAERYRAAILGFDGLEGLRAAYASPVGQELRADEDRLIARPRALLLGGEEVL
ncbi:MAG: EthD family reductase [Candidatus Rokubacteria bacterium]|nr:EthD family reductase [Candidatus Rokubacteria bacterium]MBI2526021.1 EthD family reductase [Candidatus Rokubacteria bacterium]